MSLVVFSLPTIKIAPQQKEVVQKSLTSTHEQPVVREIVRIVEKESFSEDRYNSLKFDMACQSKQNKIDTMRALLNNCPSCAYQYWLGKPNVRAKPKGDAMLVSECEQMIPDKIYWDHLMNGTCYSLLPVQVKDVVLYVKKDSLELTDRSWIIKREACPTETHSPVYSDAIGWKTEDGPVEIHFRSEPRVERVRQSKDLSKKVKTIEDKILSVTRDAVDGIAKVKPYLQDKAVEFGKKMSEAFREFIFIASLISVLLVLIGPVIILIYCLRQPLFVFSLKMCRWSWRILMSSMRKKKPAERVNNVEMHYDYSPQDYMRDLEETYRLHDVYSVVCSVSTTKLPFIAVKLNGKPFRALVDSGSTVTYIRKSTMTAIGCAQEMTKSLGKVSARTANGSIFGFLGSVELAIRVGTARLLHSVQVSEDDSCPADILLGSDFIGQLNRKGYAVSLDYSLNSIFINDEKIELVNHIVAKEREPTYVRLLNHEVIPKRSELTVPARIDVGELEKHSDYLVEDSFRQDDQIYVIGRALVTPDSQGNCYVPILNHSNTDVKLFSNSRIGVATAVPPSTVIPFTSHISEEVAIEKSMPKYSTKVDKKFNVIEHIDFKNCALSPSIKTLLCEVIKHHSDAFVGADGRLGKYNGEIRHRIDLLESATIPAARVYRQSPQKRTEIEKQVADMKEQGIIRESDSPYSAPTVLVPKADKNSYRFTVDYRALNAITRSPQSILPRIEDIIDQCAHKEIFSSMDFSQGFHQIPMEEAHCERTAFSCHLGSFEYIMMPMGLRNSPRTFQSVMDRFKKNLRAQIFAYLDDIIVPSDNQDNHIRDLDEVLLNIRKMNMKLKPEKCQFGLTEITFLGFVLSKDGIRPNPKKVSAIEKFPVPKTVTDVKSFIGAASFFRKFIENFSHVAEPLLLLTKKDTEFVWTQPQQLAFDQLKKALVTAPILASPRLGDDFIIETDASGKGLGAVLKQVQDGKEHVISYFSRALNKYEKNYPPVELEALGIVAAVKNFMPYIDGAKTLVITDHAPLKSLLFRKEVEGRLVRYQLALQGLNLVIQYRPGRHNHVADALSRYPEQVNYLNMLGDLATYDKITQSEVAVDQDSDEALKKLKSLCEAEPDKAVEKNIFVLNNVLYKLPTGINRNPVALLSPNSLLVPRIVKNFHESMFGAAHLAVQKTLSLIKSAFEWTNMEKSVRNYIKSCEHCLRVKSPNRFSIEPLQQLEDSHAPLDRVHADVIGPLPQTVSGNRYILTIVDSFTKFVVAEPMPDQKSSTLIKIFVDRFFSVFGAPTILVTDNGTNFLSNDFTKFLQAYVVQHNCSTPYHHAANGQVERMNRTIETLITQSIPCQKDDWDDLLQLVMQSYNSTKHAATSYSPFYLMFGREPKTTFHLSVSQPTPRYIDPDDYVQNVLKNLAKIWASAEHCTRKATQRATHQYNTRLQAKRSEFKLGDKVVIRLNRANKVTPLYSEPCSVTAIDYPNLYLTDANGKTKKLHANQVKRVQP